MDQLENLPGWELLFQNNNLTLNCNRQGSPFSKEFYLGRSYYYIKKSELYENYSGNKKITLDDIAELVFII